MLPDLCVLGLVFALRILPRRRKWPRSRFLLSCGLYIYFCGVLRVTLLPVVDLLYGWGDSVGQILLNMLLFLPFGALVPLRTGRGLFLTLLQAAACSATIELVQPFFDRSCDITDFITNTVGCACGYLVGLPLRPPLQRLGRWLDE